MINGDSRKFELNPNVKLYALIDAGFVKTRLGNFSYAHPLYNESPYDATAELKLTIDHDLNHLTMVITDKSGLQKVNIFKNKSLSEMVSLLNYILKDLIQREIIVQVEG